VTRPARCGAAGPAWLLARAQFTGQFDDLVGVWQRILGFEREQQVGGQPAGACAEFHDARQVHSDQRRELACQRAGEERRQFGGGDEVAAVVDVAAELGRTAAVVAQPGA
jgi:hypothetical protein